VTDEDREAFANGDNTHTEGCNLRHRAEGGARCTCDEREVCPAEFVTPGADPANASAFYVSAVDGDRRWLMAGPYETHEAALADVARVRGVCCNADGRGHFLGWGTAGFRGERKDAPEGKANSLCFAGAK